MRQDTVTMDANPIPNHVNRKLYRKITCVPVFVGGYPLGPGPNPAHPGGLSTKDCVVLPDFEHALCYAFIQDNGGPPKDVLVNFPNCHSISI